MKLFLCGFGVAGEAVLMWLSKKYGPDNLAVFTHEDGRTGSGLGRCARGMGIWYTTASVNDLAIWPFTPDIICSVYYRTIIKRPVIERVGGRIFNAHTSLLPKYRGRSPVAWALIEGDKLTGVTFHIIDDGIDTGPILFQATVQIGDTETQTSLFQKINRTVYRYFPYALKLMECGAQGIKQSGESSHHKAGVPYEGKIDSNWPIGKIERFIRAMTYPPLPYATFQGQEITCIQEYLELLDDRKRDRGITLSRQ